MKRCCTCQSKNRWSAASGEARWSGGLAWWGDGHGRSVGAETAGAPSAVAKETTGQDGEVRILAYEAMQEDGKLAGRMLGLLENLVGRGLHPKRKRLFVIDGSKALRAAIDAVFGSRNPVQRCRHHKIENVMGYLPEDLKGQVKAALRAAFRLSAAEGMVRLEKQAQWLEREHPNAAASLREGLEEMFTVNRLGLSPALRRCLCSTNLIESPHSGVRLRTRRICR